MTVRIHHFVIACDDPESRCEQFCKQFAFRKFAKQTKGNKLVAKCGNNIVVVFEKRPIDAACDSVYDIALSMDNVSQFYATASENSAQFIQLPSRMSDKHGYVEYAIVKVPIGDIQHTLIDTSHYHGEFLPGFEIITSIENGSNNIANGVGGQPTHIDHVTYVCHQGTSTSHLQWYQDCFNFSRFQINANEDEDGFVMNDLGFKLIAMQYWMCAEQGVQSNDGHFKLVFAEPLDTSVENQITIFLREHCGSGVQHIAFHTEDIPTTVKMLLSAGTAFIKPPQAYYDALEYNDFVHITNVTAVDLKEKNILVDVEPDNEQELRYLLQSFTQPLLDKRTFFFEIIQRFGAKGFGGTNIRKLFEGVEAYMHSHETPSGGITIYNELKNDVNSSV